MNTMLRKQLVTVTLAWQERYGVAPAITTSVSEFDAAMLIGFPEEDYSRHMQDRTAVGKGFDFIYQGRRYQIKANRPSGRPGSRVTLVPRAANKDWDLLIWVLYDRTYVMQEAWQWPVQDYWRAFENKSRLSPDDYRQGQRLFPLTPKP